MQKDTKKLLAVLLFMGTAGTLQSMEVEQVVVGAISLEVSDIDVARKIVFKEITTLKNCIEDLLRREKNNTITLDELIKKAITIEKRRKAFKSTLVVKSQTLTHHFQKEVGLSFRKLYANVLEQYINALHAVAKKAVTPPAMAKEALRLHYLALNHLYNELLGAGENFFTLEAKKQSTYYLDIIKQILLRYYPNEREHA